MTKNLDLTVKFICVDHRKVITRGECYVSHREINAYQAKNSPCYKCPLGDNLRLAYAGRPTLPLRSRRKSVTESARRKSEQAEPRTESSGTCPSQERQTQTGT